MFVYILKEYKRDLERWKGGFDTFDDLNMK